MVIIMKKLQTLMLAACLLPGAICMAASSDGYEVVLPPEPPIRWGAIGIAVVFGLVFMVVAFKNAKRTHLD